MIGEHIKQLRAERNLSLAQLAELSGVNKSYLSKVERGLQKNPSISIVRKLSVAFDVSLDELTSQDESVEEDWDALLQRLIESGATIQEFQEFVNFKTWQRKSGGN
jgi:XRE family transcriptional regulator of biofilm formation